MDNLPVLIQKENDTIELATHIFLKIVSLNPKKFLIFLVTLPLTPKLILFSRVLLSFCYIM